MANKNMVNCKVCGAEIAKNSKTCPHCGAKNKKGHPILIIFALLLVVLLFSCGGESDDNSVSDKYADRPVDAFMQATNNKVSIVKEPEIVKIDYGHFVQGELRNITTKEIDSIYIEFVFYDKNGVQIGDTISSTEHLGPDKVWRYECWVDSDIYDQVESFEFADITIH